MKTILHKHQTPAQRVTNPVWLRAQIQALIQGCDDNVDSDRHWKSQLERVLRGKTYVEDLRDACKTIALKSGRSF